MWAGADLSERPICLVAKHTHTLTDTQAAIVIGRKRENFGKTNNSICPVCAVQSQKNANTLSPSLSLSLSLSHAHTLFTGYIGEYNTATILDYRAK